ncbi:MAG: hypothetical protein RLZZ401_2067 [Pseudomonadota bacterium]
MRLRIVHQLSLLLIGAVVLSVAAVGGVVLLNLRSGFSEYLQARDDVQLDRFVQLVERHAASDPGMDWLRGSRQSMEALGNEFAAQEGLSRRPPGPPPPPRGGGRNPPEGILGRVQIFDLDGGRIAGRGQPLAEATETRAVKVAGRTVAWVRLTREPQLQAVDARFLQRQYLGLALAAGTTLALMLALAWWVARRWSQPLRRLQQATQRMAEGELGGQVPPAGAREIASLIDDVNRMSSSLARLEAARRVWIAQLSHELRTPLAVLRGEIESIEDGARQPTPDVMASLRDEVLQLIRLVNDLHTLSMADLGQLRCEFVDGAVAALIERVTQRFAARAVQHGLVLRVAPGPAVSACWDWGRMEQVLTNLLENSVRYTRSPGTVCVTWQRSAQGLRLTVEDSAPGVPATELPQLFEPLYRSDVARVRRTDEQGSGLGLSIALAIVVAHRGTMHASASDLGGLAVSLDLPLTP